MAAITYPSTLPAPQQLPLTPAERRLVSELDGVRIAGVHQRDWSAVQTVSFTFSSAEMAVFRDWWKNALTLGGAWFSATWPQPQGGAGVRRFIGGYRRDFVVGYGWRVSAVTEIRGSGADPTPAGAGAGLSDTVALLKFDAYPFADEVAENGTSAAGFTGANIVGTPVITGSAGALSVPAGSTGNVDTEPATLSGLASRALEVEGLTVEYFARFDGTRGTTWDVEGDATFVDDDGNRLAVSLEVINSPSLIDIAGGDDPALDHVGFNFSSNILDFPASPVTYFPYSAPDAAYVHFALVVDVDEFRVYAGGMRQGVMTATVLVPAAIAALKLQSADMIVTGSGTGAHRYVDGFRVSRGALYSGASFTPPAAQFTYP